MITLSCFFFSFSTTYYLLWNILSCVHLIMPLCVDFPLIWLHVKTCPLCLWGKVKLYEILSGLIRRSLFWNHCAIVLLLRTLVGAWFIWWYEDLSHTFHRLHSNGICNIYIKNWCQLINLKCKTSVLICLGRGVLTGLNIAIYHLKYSSDKVCFKIILVNNKCLDVTNKIWIKMQIFNWINTHAVFLCVVFYFLPRKDFVFDCTKNYWLCSSSTPIIIIIILFTLLHFVPGKKKITSLIFF